MRTKTHGFTVGYYRSPRCGSRQNVFWNDICAERTSWRFANFSNRINAAGWTFRKIPFCIKFNESVVTFAFNIRPDVVYRNNIVGFCVVFQRPFIFCSINLSHIIYASVGRRSPRISNKIRNRKKSKEQKDCSNDNKIPQERRFIF